MSEPQDHQREEVARPAGLVSLATLCSRVTGLLREAVFAALFATRGVADAYIFAFRIPNLLREFFAEGALSSAFVPTFAEARAKEGEARAFRLAAHVMGTLAAVAGLLVLLGILFAPAIVSVVAMDANPELQPVTIRMTRIMFPFLLVIALAAVAMGVLNTYKRYFLPALAPMFFNVTAVVGGIVLLLLDLDALTAVTIWAALVVVGGAMQFLIQVPALRAVGLREWPTVDLRFRDPGLRQIVRRMGPVVLSLTATNVMLVITTILASRGEGWASSLNYAFRLVHLPIGLVGVALGTVLLAAGARRSAAADGAGLDDVVRRGLRLNWFLALPAAAGLFVLSEPLVRLIYERGAFGPDSTARVAEREGRGALLPRPRRHAHPDDVLAGGHRRHPRRGLRLPARARLPRAGARGGSGRRRELSDAAARGAAALRTRLGARVALPRPLFRRHGRGVGRRGGARALRPGPRRRPPKRVAAGRAGARRDRRPGRAVLPRGCGRRPRGGRLGPAPVPVPSTALTDAIHTSSGMMWARLPGMVLAWGMSGWLIAGGALVLLWVIVTFNAFVRLGNRVREAYSGIDVQLKRRHDLVPNLVRVVKGYAQHEQETLEEVVRLRDAAASAEALPAREQTETGLARSLTRLFALVERYPDLRADKNFRKLQEDLVELEDHLQYARRYYNGAVRDHNTRIQRIPDNLLAALVGRREQPFFQLDSAAEGAVPTVSMGKDA